MLTLFKSVEHLPLPIFLTYSLQYPIDVATLFLDFHQANAKNHYFFVMAIASEFHPQPVQIPIGKSCSLS